MRHLFFILIATVSAVAQPSINSGGIVNAASYAASPLGVNGNPIGNNSVAQGSFFSIFGSGLGPSNPVFPSSLPLGTNLPDAKGTSVTISSGGILLMPSQRLPRQTK
jgi:hypothetical protein